MPDFIFDPTDHKYTVDGEEYPSITTLLKPLTSYDNVPEFQLQRAAEFGKAVHKGVEDYLTVGEASEMPDDVALCFSGFPRFWAEHPEWHSASRIIERPMYHPRLKYAGTPDIILVDIATIEVKTRLFSKKTDPLQLRAQEQLFEANGGKLIERPKYVLELHKDGTHKLVPAEDRQAWNKFRYLLEHHWKCWEWEENIRKWRNQK